MRTTTVVIGVLAALAVSGCAKEIDAAKAEKFISKTVAAQVGAELKSVSCPSGLTAKKGETFECTVTGTDGTTGKTEVTEKDDQGNVSVSAPFIHPRDIERSIATDIKAQVGSAVKVSCPEIIVSDKGGKFGCEATSGSDKARVDVTQTDDQGNVDYKVQR